MHATIRLSESESYQFPLFKKEPSKIASAYKLAVSVCNVAFAVIKLIGLAILSPVAGIFYLVDRLSSLISSKQSAEESPKEKALNAEEKALNAGKIDSIAYANINHSYAEAPKEQKQALEEHIFKKLKKHTPQLSDEQRGLLAHEIANNPKIYDKGGLCRPYSLLFSAYVLKHQDSFKGAKDLKDRFIQDISTKTYAPLIAFSSYLNFKALVKTEKDGSIIVESKKMHKPWSSEKKSNKMMSKLGYPSFQRFTIVDHVVLLKKSLSLAEEMVSISNELCDLKERELRDDDLSSRDADLRHNLEKDKATRLRKKAELETKLEVLKKSQEKMKELDEEFKKALSFEEKILYCGKYYDDNAFYLLVPKHAMSFYINAKKGQFIFFDPNFGVVNFASVQDLAKGVSKYSEVVYGKLESIQAISYT